MAPKKISSSDVKQGDILWLPPYKELVAKRTDDPTPPVSNLTMSNITPNEEFYNHPILIVSRPAASPNTIQFLLLTTFGGKTLVQRFGKHNRGANWQQYLTLDPHPDHPLWLTKLDPTYMTLTYEGEAPTTHGGFVKISEVYEMELRYAQPYRPKVPAAPRRTRLDARSMETVLKAVDSVAGWRPGEQIVRTIPSRIEHTTTATLTSPAALPVTPPATPPSATTIHYHSESDDTRRKTPHRPVFINIPVDPATVPLLESSRPVVAARTALGRGGLDGVLPVYHERVNSRKDSARQGLCAWLWDCLKSTTLGVIARSWCWWMEGSA